MLNPSGSRSYMGIYYELAEGVPAASVQTWLKMASEGLNPDFKFEPDPNISSRGTRGVGKLLAVDFGPGSHKFAAFDADSIGRLRANQRKKVVNSVLSAPDSAYRHVMTKLMPEDPDEAVYRQTLGAIIYRADGVPMRLDGGKVSAMNLVMPARDFATLEHTLAFANYSESGDAVADGGNNAAGADILVFSRGVRRDPDSSDYVLVEATTPGALDGTAGFKFRIGAGALGGPSTEVKPLAGVWYDVEDETGTPIGPDVDQPFQVMLYENGASVMVTAGDKYTIPALRTVATPTYSDRKPFTVNGASITVDGDEIKFSTGTLKCSTPTEADEGGGSITPYSILDWGEEYWTLEIDRAYLSRTAVNALRTGAVADVVIDLRGAKLGNSAYRDGINFALRMQYSQAGTNVANSKGLREKVVFEGVDDGTEVCTETLDNTIVTL